MISAESGCPFCRQVCRACWEPAFLEGMHRARPVALWMIPQKVDPRWGLQTWEAESLGSSLTPFGSSHC